ncbi:MAG TPA: Gfo/Idh/MocA family oxidoreductase [Pseudonocardia sp.]|jgi:myo-inositol 2-dehydrogenase/D-chiro-inositol 1-dehydrogenase|uniref:Gfo/Idh/MocA family oxidoreductase n=1 Tax=Pseudonocardia sp. TaxID=60912 RepID=UPI002B4B3884|nr:Gfo/Idh/MocA family oxidoreductase [Pseudonocardia sp.]HLU56489.1 Gfo/Idh/MocA family oxidoreductase [Pseudonocardia sp.]
MAELRIGLVGAGRLGEQGYVPALAAAAGVRLAAVAEPDEARRARVAGAAGVPGYRSAEDLLAAGGVDALVLATPASAHLADARLAAAAGLPALVEKPPAADVAEAAELAALEPTPWIGFNRRFDDGVARLREAVPRGAEVGVFCEISYRRAGWDAHTVRDDALTDLGPHLVDLARWLTGADVTDVRRADVRRERAGFDLVLGAARARIRCATDRPYRERIEVRHRDGRLVGRLSRGGLVAAVRGRLASRGPHPLVASLTAQLEAFARAVRGELEPTLATAEDGVAVMAALDAVRAARLSG